MELTANSLQSATSDIVDICTSDEIMGVEEGGFFKLLPLGASGAGLLSVEVVGLSTTSYFFADSTAEDGLTTGVTGAGLLGLLSNFGVETVTTAVFGSDATETPSLP